MLKDIKFFLKFETYHIRNCPQDLIKHHNFYGIYYNGLIFGIINHQNNTSITKFKCVKPLFMRTHDMSKQDSKPKNL